MLRGIYTFFIILTISMAMFHCETQETSAGDPDSVASIEARDCEATHENVGLVAELEGRGSYGVAGQVEIIDDCTLRATNFSYNGTGAAAGVFFYLGSDSSFSDGTIISNDLLEQTFDGDTITLTIPESMTLDDFSHISIWCEQFGISFGDGEFL